MSHPITLADSPVTSADPEPSATPSAPPQRGWTAERRVLFLDRLAVHGNARAACRAVGLSAESAYRLRRRDADFARAWDAAVLLGRDNSVEVLSERAIEGVEEEIWFRGEMIGTRRRYDSRLLLAHLARLDKLVENAPDRSQEWAAHFDAVLAAIAAGEPVGEAIGREAYAEREASDAVACMRGDAIDGYYAENEGIESITPYRNAHQAPSEDRERADAFMEGLDDECEMLDREIREMARAEYDAKLARLHRLVDGEGIRPAPPPAHALALIRAARQPAKSFPCTASTVSTSALARGMAGPVVPRVETPRSPLRRS